MHAQWTRTPSGRWVRGVEFGGQGVGWRPECFPPGRSRSSARWSSTGCCAGGGRTESPAEGASHLPEWRLRRRKRRSRRGRNHLSSLRLGRKEAPAEEVGPQSLRRGSGPLFSEYLQSFPALFCTVRVRVEPGRSATLCSFAHPGRRESLIGRHVVARYVQLNQTVTFHGENGNVVV